MSAESNPVGETNFTFQARECPVCASGRSEVVFHVTDFQYGSDVAGDVNRLSVTVCLCVQFGLLYNSPCPTIESLPHFLSFFGQSYGSSSEGPARQAARLLSNGLLAAGTHLVDFGAFEGDLLSEFPESVSATGYEFDSGAISRGNKRLAGNKHLVQVDAATYDRIGSGDVFTMFHVLEHLLDPVEVLSTLRNLSQPSSRLVVEVPLLEFSEDTEDVSPFFSAQHFSHFTERTLRQTLRAAGWLIEHSEKVQGFNGFCVLCQPCPTLLEIDPMSISSSRFGVQSFVSAFRKRCESLSSRLNEHIGPTPNESRLGIWGAGSSLEFLRAFTSLRYILAQREILLLDRDPTKTGMRWRGNEIAMPSRENLNHVGHALVASYASQRRIVEQLHSLGFDDDGIISLYHQSITT